MKRFLPNVATAVCAVSLLAGCATSTSDFVSSLNPFKIDIRQGNFVSQEMVAQLKPGQTREQVRFILGSPLVDDIFHADRWDYIYRFQPGRGETQQRRLIVFFEGNQLVRVAGDVVASDPNAPEPTAPSVRTLEIEGTAPAESKPAAQPAVEASPK